MTLCQSLMLPPGYGFDASNASPVITVPGAQSATSNVAKAITGTSIADAESNNQTVSISVSHGTFSLASTNGLSFTVGDGTADASMTFSGTLANVNTAIATLNYTSTTDYSGSDTLTINSTDSGGGAATQKTVAITVTWTPLSLGANLVVWFDPGYGVYSDAGITSAVVNDPVYRWSARNDSTYYFQQTTLGKRPIYKQAAGGDFYIESNGSSHELGNVKQIAPSTATMLIQLYKLSTSNDQGGYGVFSSGGNTHTNFIDGNIYDSFGTNSRASFTGLSWQNNWIRYVCTAQSGSLVFRSNGTQIYSRASNTVAWNSASQQFLMSDGAPGFWFNARYGHFVVSSALSGGSLSALESWALTEIPA